MKAGDVADLTDRMAMLASDLEIGVTNDLDAAERIREWIRELEELVVRTPSPEEELDLALSGIRVFQEALSRELGRGR